MGVTLAEDLLLLAYDDEGNAHVGTPQLDYALAGALLMELTLDGRLAVADGALTVVDPAPTGDPLLDEALTRIAAEPTPRKPQAWIDPLSAGLVDRVLTRLIDAGVLRREEGRVLWVFPRTRYPSTTGGEPAEEVAVRAELAAALDGDGTVAPRTAALCALVPVVRLEGVAFPDRPRKEVAERLKRLAAHNWPAAAVREAIEEVEAGITAALTTVFITTTATTTS